MKKGRTYGEDGNPPTTARSRSHPPSGIREVSTPTVRISFRHIEGFYNRRRRHLHWTISARRSTSNSFIKEYLPLLNSMSTKSGEDRNLF
jgi:hypothetical protein